MGTSLRAAVIEAGGRLRCALASWQARRTPAETEARQHAARQLTWWLDADGASADAAHLDASRWPTLAQ